jgi:hypothetical protein
LVIFWSFKFIPPPPEPEPEPLLRQVLNRIFIFIGVETLSDDEYNSLTINLDSNSIETYQALLAILETRDSVSQSKDRLRYYFQAKNAAIEEPDEDTFGDDESNILVGSSLQDFIAVEDPSSEIFVGGAL